MSPLLILTGMLVLSSALVLLRTGARMGAGVPIPALIQLIAGVVVSVLGFSSAPGGSTGLVVVVASVLLVLATAIFQAVRVRAHRRAREASEGARLETYVKYLSRDISRD